MSQRNRDVYIYVIGREEGPVKIGISSSPGARLGSIQTGCPFRVALLHCQQIRGRERALSWEKNLHETYARWRLEGEWFDVRAPYIIETVEAVGEIERLRGFGCASHG